MLFEKENLKVRLLQEGDKLLLVKWLSDPEVLEYYEGRDNSFDLEKVNQKFYFEEKEVVRCIVEFHEEEIGYIQFYLLNKKTSALAVDGGRELAFEMDQFIGETQFWNKGIGSLLVKSMVEYLVEQKRLVKVIMDPRITNVRAVRCYEKCGFKKIKLLPKHELHEGELRDCWLMAYR